jgi:predicted nucleic acid-binding protein
MTVRAVFDCMVFLQGAAREASPAGVCLQLVKDGQITLCLSPEVFAEIRDVLTRPKTQQKFKTLTPQRVEAFLQELQRQAIFFPAVAKVFSYPRDPVTNPTSILPVRPEHATSSVGTRTFST